MDSKQGRGGQPWEAVPTKCIPRWSSRPGEWFSDLNQEATPAKGAMPSAGERVAWIEPLKRADPRSGGSVSCSGPGRSSPSLDSVAVRRLFVSQKADGLADASSLAVGAEDSAGG